MKVFFHEDFYQVYNSDPASAPGRMEAVVEVIGSEVEFVAAEPAKEEDIARVHTREHIDYVKEEGLYPIAALSAGGAVQAALTGLTEPCFALIRPPGHHASSESSWGFCYFNNMSISLKALKSQGKIKTACVLDIDMHYGDGNVNILEPTGYVSIYNFDTHDRIEYMNQIKGVLDRCKVDMIGVSAGFDNHIKDWGGVLATDDYTEIGRLLRHTSQKSGAGCFAILEGGYNHSVLGQNVLALIKGMNG
jgi:acetoin utilization deacetylase AcuC-like enzyme